MFLSAEVFLSNYLVAPDGTDLPWDCAIPSDIEVRQSLYIKSDAITKFYGLYTCLFCSTRIVHGIRQVFVLCYDATERSAELISDWVDDIRRKYGNLPIMLVRSRVSLLRRY